MAAVESGQTPKPSDPRQEFFGTRVSPRTFQHWLTDISAVLQSGQRNWLSAHHNMHSLYMLRRDSDVRRFYARCNDCYVDGTPVRLILMGFGARTTSAQRFSLMDHFLELLQYAEKEDWSLFYLGSQPAVVETGRALIGQLFPKLRIRLRDGYSPWDPGLLQSINDWRPDILLVGMGMPLQERWVMQHLPQLDVGVISQAGGTLDYYTGAQAKPPRWLSRIGFAWLHRLLNDPARMWRRYLVEPWGLLRPTLRQWYRFQRSRTCND